MLSSHSHCMQQLHAQQLQSLYTATPCSVVTVTVYSNSMLNTYSHCIQQLGLKPQDPTAYCSPEMQGLLAEIFLYWSPRLYTFITMMVFIKLSGISRVTITFVRML